MDRLLSPFSVVVEDRFARTFSALAVRLVVALSTALGTLVGIAVGDTAGFVAGFVASFAAGLSLAVAFSLFVFVGVFSFSALLHFVGERHVYDRPAPR